LYGGIFPEPLSLFTLQSFGAFYFSLSISVLAVITASRLNPITVHVGGGFVMIALITIAALVHWSAFNFSLYPRQSIYIGVYVLGFVVTLVYFWDYRARLRAFHAAVSPGATTS
jgi:hypothetical protein